MPLSLLCDEHIPYPVIEGLRRRGIDVTVVHTDFLRLHAAGVRHVGIFYHHPDAYGYGEAIRRVGFACEVYSVAEMNGRVEFI